MFKSIATVLALAIPAVSFADQCAVVSREQAKAFLKMVKPGNYLGHLCEPCGEVPTEAGGPLFEKVDSLSIKPWEGSKTEVTVEVNGRTVDLAYAFVKTAQLREATVAVNAAFLVGCPAERVTNRFIIGD